MIAGIVRPLVHIISLYLLYSVLQNLSLEGLYLLGRPALGWLRVFLELKWRAICLIEDSRFGKDFFGKF